MAHVEVKSGHLSCTEHLGNLAGLSQVDILSWRRKTDRIHAQIKDICAILSGLLVAQDYRKGQELIKDKDFQENAAFFQASKSTWSQDQ